MEREGIIAHSKSENMVDLEKNHIVLYYKEKSRRFGVQVFI
jgi:hypothetical protein